MFLVIGNTPQRVELKDLGDYIYYKQQKVFTEAQYSRSQDLQREIQKGSLTILKRTEEKSGSFEVPSVTYTNVPPKENSGVDSSKLDVLLERIQSLELAINTNSKAPKEVQPDVVGILSEKISRLEGELSGVSNEQSLTVLYNAIKKLEERIDKGSSNSELLQKLEDIVNRAPAYVSVQDKPKEETRPEDVYVPTVIVEDANTHIKLNVRSIESGDNVSDSLRKLKELKSKFK
jgi:hypothetical protein